MIPGTTFNALDALPKSVSGQWTARYFRHHHREIAAKVRKDIAAVCRHLKAGYRNTVAPEESHLVNKLTFRALRIMHNAMMDCFTADKAAGAAAGKYRFLERLNLTTPGQVRSVDFFALRPELLRWEAAEAIKAWAEDDDGKAAEKQYLEMLRDMFRTGMTTAQVLQTLSECGILRQMAEEGRVQFFINLGGELRKAHAPFLTQRILDAWIPLNLAACAPDGGDAHTRFEEYARSLHRPLIDYPQFKTAWNNVRNKRLAQLCVWLKKPAPDSIVK